MLTTQPASLRNDYETKRKQLKLQVRSSPKKSAAKKTKKQQTQFPSTNVSSPVRAPKQLIRQFAYEDDDDGEDYFEPAPQAAHKKASRSHKANASAVFEAEDDFAPVRVAKPVKSTKAKGLGTPITVDERTANLTDFQHDVLRDFMGGAKDLRKGIMQRKNHREAIFTDTVLREMGIELPWNLAEMHAIRGIRPEMVDLYGKHFLPLIANSRACYGEEVPVSQNPIPRRRQARVVHEVDDDNEEVDDQNHRLVVDLCSDSDNIPGALEDESDYSFDDDDGQEEEEDNAVHISHHFTPHHDPQVAEFNNRYSQLGGPAPAKPSKPAAAPRATSRSSGAGFKKKSFRKKGSAGSGTGYAGVKRRAPKATGVRESGGAGSAKRATGGGTRRPGGSGGGSGGGAGGWGSIMAMPT